MKTIRIILLLIILAAGTQSYAQLKRIGIPYIREMLPDEYQADRQNWQTISDRNGIMYFCNKDGLMEFDGITWSIIKDSTGTPCTSAAICPDSDSIYVGYKGDIGVLRTSPNGTHEFVSFKHLIPAEYTDFNDNITEIAFSSQEGTVFCAGAKLIILKDNSINVIENVRMATYKMFQVGGRIFVWSLTDGAQELVDGNLVARPEFAPAGDEVLHIEQYGKDGWLVISRDGVFSISGETCVNAIQESSPEMAAALRNAICITKDHLGNYLFGTQKDGLLAFNKNMSLIKKVAIQPEIYSIYQDISHLTWLATQNGIYLIDLYSPFSMFPNTMTGISGPIRAVLQNGDDLYIGTNTVFHIKLAQLGRSRFSEIANPIGNTQIWKLDTIGGTVFGGSGKGMFLIDQRHELRNIDKDRNIRDFKSPRTNPDIIVACGGTNGGAIYSREGGSWRYRGSAQGFDFCIRTLYEDSNGDFWGSYKYQGISRMTFNATYDTIVSLKRYNAENGLPGDIDNYLFSTSQGLIAGTPDGIYRYSGGQDIFEPDTVINAMMGGKKEFDFMYNDLQGSLWAKHIKTYQMRRGDVTDWYLEQYKNVGDSLICIERPFRPFKSRISTFGYIGNGCYIIGDQNGFVHYDSNIPWQQNFQSPDGMMPYKAHIRGIENIYNDSIIYGGNGTDRPIVLTYADHSIRIGFSATTFKYPEQIQFRTYLENNDDQWSDYRSETYKEYPGLRPGTYTMHVVARNVYGQESEEATLRFEILPPWYLTIWAIILYVILFGLLIWLIIRLYTMKLKRDNQKLEQLVQERTAEILAQSQLIIEQNKEITEKNKSITDSINYAKHIQTAMLPLKEKISSVLPNHFILFRPKDIVSGDYYWFAETDKYIIITAADCTGHGVPGAFMSMIGSQILTEIVADGITSPDDILTNQNRRIRKALKQDTTDNHDGMDMALCTINKESHEVEFAGAKNQLVVIQNGELTEYKADKQGIGGDQMFGEDFHFKKCTITPDGNTWFYMFSDGYKDQFGGPENSKFLIKNLRKLLLEVHNEEPEKQREILNTTIQDWIDTGHGEQTDDIILLGFKL